MKKELTVKYTEQNELPAIMVRSERSGIFTPDEGKTTILTHYAKKDDKDPIIGTIFKTNSFLELIQPYLGMLKDMGYINI